MPSWIEPVATDDCCSASASEAKPFALMSSLVMVIVVVGTATLLSCGIRVPVTVTDCSSSLSSAWTGWAVDTPRTNRGADGAHPGTLVPRSACEGLEQMAQRATFARGGGLGHSDAPWLFPRRTLSILPVRSEKAGVAIRGFKQLTCHVARRTNQLGTGRAVGAAFEPNDARKFNIQSAATSVGPCCRCPQLLRARQASMHNGATHTQVLRRCFCLGQPRPEPNPPARCVTRATSGEGKLPTGRAGVRRSSPRSR